MKNKIILLLLLFASSCKSLELLEIGSSIPVEVQNNAVEANYTLLNASTILPLYYCSKHMSVGGNNGIVEFIKDETPGKYFSGMKIGDKIIFGSELFSHIQAEIGVCFYIPVGDGWNAFIGDINTDEEDFEVLFFFKKEYSGAGIFMSYEEYKIWLKKLM